MHDDLTALLGNASLEEVRFRELTCRLKSEVSRELQLEPRFRLGTRLDPEYPEFFTLLLRLECDIDDGSDLAVEVAARYKVTSQQPPELTHALMVGFANETGVSDMLPFIRQAIAYLTAEVFGDAFLMPTTSRDGLYFSTAAAS